MRDADADTITVTTKVLEESLHMSWERSDTSHPQPGQRFLLSPGPHLDDYVCLCLLSRHLPCGISELITYSHRTVHPQKPGLLIGLLLTSMVSDIAVDNCAVNDN